MSSFRRILGLFMSSVIFAGSNMVWADGISVRKWLTMREVVARSAYIFIAKIIRTNHKYAKRQAYGEMRRYVARYRFQVEIKKVFKGQRLLKRVGARIWLERSGGYVPGKWVLVYEKYRESFNFFRARKGQQLIVYARSIFNNTVFFNYGDTLGNQRALRLLITNAKKQ